jgi:hypothetical protein
MNFCASAKRENERRKKKKNRQVKEKCNVIGRTELR